MSTRSSDNGIISQGFSTDWTFLFFDGSILSLSLFLFNESFSMFEQAPLDKFDEFLGC
jgi:hypothetical protein